MFCKQFLIPLATESHKKTKQLKQSDEIQSGSQPFLFG